MIDELAIPAVGHTYVYDALVGGLCLFISAAGTMTWYVYRKVNGRPEREKIGRWPQIGVEHARDEATKIIARHVDGVTGNDVRRAKRGLPTLKSVFDLFIGLPTRTKEKRPKSPETVVGYRRQFSYLAAWHNRKLNQITQDDVKQLHEQLSKDSGIYLANRVLSLVKVLFNVAIKDLKHPIANPAAGVSPFAEETRERWLQAEELPKFWAALEAEPSEKIRDFVKLLLFTGQRKSNVLQMQWSNIDLIRGVWTIPQTKTGKHEVPLSAPAQEILLRRKAMAAGPYVLPGRHGKGHLQDVMRQWRSIIKAAGIAHLRLHDLRRSIGSWQINTGANTAIVGKTLGHVRPETTAIYSRVSQGSVRNSLETAGAAILAAAKPSKKRRKK